MKNYIVLLFLFLVAGLYSQPVEDYILEYKCPNSDSTECLEETSYLATRSDGRKVLVHGVYNWRGTNENKDIFQPHFLLEYMKLLRNAFGSSDEYGTQLYNQVDFTMSKLVDRNGILVWENYKGAAQAMEQMEFAAYYATVAKLYAEKNDQRTAVGFMSHALKMIRSLEMVSGYRTGGVVTFGGFGGKKEARFRPCYWYNSRGLGIKHEGVKTVLNQHLHVVRDALSMYIIIENADDLILPQYGTVEEVRGFLIDRAIGGLYQLAFSAGNKKSFAYRPPNIYQFMEDIEGRIASSAEHPDGNPLSYYWSFYEFNMDTGKGKNISHKKTCHYHMHVLNLIAGIHQLTESNKDSFLEHPNGWRVYEALDELLKYDGEQVGQPNSKNPIFQFYASTSDAYLVRRLNCLADGRIEVLSDYARQFYEDLYK